MKLFVATVCLLSVAQSLPQGNFRERIRERLLGGGGGGGRRGPQTSLDQCISEPPISSAGLPFNPPPEFRNRIRQELGNARTAYVPVYDAGATDCDDYLDNEVILGNPIKDLCQSAGAGAEVRACFVPPPVLVELAQGNRKKRQIDPDFVRQIIQERIAAVRSLSDADLLDIPRTTEFFKGACIRCPAL